MGHIGWIGVDLDGTLAVYGGWNGGQIGEPVEAMLRRVRGWRASGIDVRIVTARVTSDPAMRPPEEVAEQRVKVEAWCAKFLGEVLPVTDRKDFHMLALWDDRAVTVATNLGVPAAGIKTRGGIIERVFPNKSESEAILPLSEAAVREVVRGGVNPYPQIIVRPARVQPLEAPEHTTWLVALAFVAGIAFSGIVLYVLHGFRG